jgi:hypothetical protein
MRNCDRPTVRWKDDSVEVYGHGHHLVRLGSIVYMAPRLVLHYIVEHRYRPPDEFVEAVVSGKFLKRDDLIVDEAFNPFGWLTDK